MLKLHGYLPRRWDDKPFVVRITTSSDRPIALASREALLVRNNRLIVPDGFRTVLTCGSATFDDSRPFMRIPESLGYLADGDIVRIVPRTAEIAVLYRKASKFNAMLVTDQCNSNCLMCSQPPKDADDGYLADVFLEAIPLMDPGTPELGITGGEPTLLGDRLLDLISACKLHLPQTSLHILSNGRLFNYLSLCRDVASIDHPDLMIGIPIYSDIAGLHDMVVQAKGAFDQTLRGIINLKRVGVKVEVRVVLHRQTTERLSDLARFLARNLPFVDHVALMGLEMMGHVKMNLEGLWIDPFDYQPRLVQAVRQLVAAKMNVSVYNHQLCVLDRELWPFARKSISDWKNEYLPICEHCSVQQECGGFFSSAKVRFSSHISALSAVAIGESIPGTATDGAVLER